MALYHKYRPESLADMRLTQPEVEGFFTKALAEGKLGHIYLMVGSHGIGKTSTARILSRAVNCLGKKVDVPCNKCENCLSILAGSFVDVYELDAASHRGIDDVRALQEVIRLAPVIGKTKVYIIDEVHMLTTEAFNALLKTFEEPPAQRLFLLCTTELHKVPATIQSRATVVQFAKPTERVVADYISKIVLSEGAQITEGAALALARAADGAFRDGAKLTEQLLVQSKMLTEEVVNGYFVGAKLSPRQLVEIVRKGAVADLMALVAELELQGGNVPYFIRASISLVRDDLRLLVSKGENVIFEMKLLRALQQALVDVKSAPIAGLALEVAMMEMMLVDQIGRGGERNAPKVVAKKDEVDNNLDKIQEITVEKSVENEHKSELKIGAEMVRAEDVLLPSVDKIDEQLGKEVVSSTLKIKKMEKLETASTVVNLDYEKVKERWREVVTLVKGANASVASVLRISPPKMIDGNALILMTTYKLHKERLEATKNRQLVESALYELFGVQLRVDCHLIQQATKKKDVENVAVVADEGLVEAALEIFAN